LCAPNKYFQEKFNLWLRHFSNPELESARSSSERLISASTRSTIRRFI